MLGEFISSDVATCRFDGLQPVGLMARQGPQNLVANSPRNTKN